MKMKRARIESVHLNWWKFQLNISFFLFLKFLSRSESEFNVEIIESKHTFFAIDVDST